MIVDLCRLSLITGVGLLCLGLLVHATLHAYVMTLGDLYLMFRRVRARAFRHLRTVRAVLRSGWLRRHDGSPCRVALSRKGNPAPNPVTRAATTPSDTAPHGAAAVTGSPGPVVPIPPQRGNGAAGPAHTSVTPADAPSRAIREESVPQTDSFARGGVLAPADMGGRVTGAGYASTHLAAAQRRQCTDGDGCVAAASTSGNGDAR